MDLEGLVVLISVLVEQNSPKYSEGTVKPRYPCKWNPYSTDS
jgi:hypothetical protein